ncbi:MAG TPA: S41 family peptidase [Candidatus Paceibacterota bacterium]|nr:S41 family peptidase [Candidatus Paceibacterota bacterium]
MKDIYRSRIAIGIINAAVIVAAFIAGFYAADRQMENSHATILSFESGGQASTSENVDMTPFWKAWNIIDDNFVGATTTASSTQARVYGAIEGMTAAYGDPYTTFFPPQQNQIFQSEISGSFGGVGMEMGAQDGNLVVISPLKDTPAYAAGIKPGDIITKIDNTDATTLTVDAAVALIRGDVGTKVTLTIERKGVSAPLIIPLIRTTINVPTIETATKYPSDFSTSTASTLTKNSKNAVFVISFYTFTADSPILFKNALEQFANSGETNLIIDLRGNPGGYLDAAVDIASWFLPSDDTVVSEEYKDGTADVYKSKGYNVFANTPVKVALLVDGGSASASEILSGALHDYNKAILVGTQTFGKGSVQELFPVTSDTSIKVTIAKWLTPKGVSISEKGITPDYVIENPPNAVVGTVTDLQMAKAVDLLTQNN